MTRARVLLAAPPLLAVLLPALPAAAAQAAGSAAPDGSTTVTYTVPADDDGNPLTPPVGIHLEVVEPTLHGVVVPSPVILTYSPYSVLGRNGDAATWTPLGIARAYADVVGTGDSGGCYDYGGDREKRTGHDVVQWIGAQPWSTGKVGMLGGSYDGTTQYATAITHPSHLVTIVPEVAIDRWYSYAYSGGMRYTYTTEPQGPEGAGTATDEGVDTPAGFDFGFAVPPPTDVTSPDWASRVQSRTRVCDQLAHTTRGYDQAAPAYDAFWQERDYVAGLRATSLPVLVAGNWGDWNVKQENGIEAWSALRSRPAAVTRLFEGTRWRGHGTPPDDGSALGFATVVRQWFQHYLLGADNGMPGALPDVVSQPADGTGTLLPYTRDPVSNDVALALGAGTLTAAPAPGATGATAEPLAVDPAGTESASLQAPAGAPAHLAWQTAALPHDVRVVGSPRLQLWSTAQQRWLTLTASLVDVGATGPAARVGVTRAWQDTRTSADGRTAQPDRTPNVATATDLVLKPTDYVFRAGHRLALLVQTSQADWVEPGVADTCLAGPACLTVSVDPARSRLVLPVVDATSAAGLLGDGAPPPVVPEAPSPWLLPLLAAGLTAAVVLRRRRA